jgi:serine protease AprX
MLNTIITKDRKHDHFHSQNRFSVIPITEKLGADSRYRGKGVRIAFLDSGFYPHPDYIDRVVHFHDVSDEEKSLHSIITPAGHHWHGTQTVATCAGNGSLSDRVFSGVASEAELVLVKVSENGRVNDSSIEKGLDWIMANHEKYQIRIVNISLGGDCDLKITDSVINQLAEELVRRGVVITAAAGNSADQRPIPPATAPSVITVGGFSDFNQLDRSKYELYHSSFGETADGLHKPEIIAPAMYVAAPILPGTASYFRAELLSMLIATPDYALSSMIKEYWNDAGLNGDILNADTENARKIIEYAIHRDKVVGTHYQHVDGTSFAAPISASVVAQMLEGNPSLSPPAVKQILTSTALRIAGANAARQGFGLLNAPGALRRAIEERHSGVRHFRMPFEKDGRIHFHFHHDMAASVSLAGDFDWWRPFPLSRDEDGIWTCSISKPASGRYQYKFFVDRNRWTEDPSHELKVEDGSGGFNSVLIVI